jgi:hypothetical protein
MCPNIAVAELNFAPSQKLQLKLLHSLHCAFCFPCAQKADPPHSWQSAFCFPCAQKADPPHSLQRDFRFPCAQKADPPHSWQCGFCFPCSHKADPPHALQRTFRVPCSQKADPPHALQYTFCFPWAHFFFVFPRARVDFGLRALAFDTLMCRNGARAMLRPAHRESEELLFLQRRIFLGRPARLLRGQRQI